MVLYISVPLLATSIHFEQEDSLEVQAGNSNDGGLSSSSCFLWGINHVLPTSHKLARIET